MAILGYDTKGSDVQSGGAAGRKYATKYTLDDDAIMTSLHCWFRKDSTGGTNNVTLGVYSDTAGAPGALVYCSPLTALGGGAGDEEVIIPGLTVALTAGDIWLTFGTEGGGNSGLVGVYGEDPGGTHKGKISGAAIDPMSDPFGTIDTTGSRKHSIWAVTAAAGGGGVIVGGLGILTPELLTPSWED